MVINGAIVSDLDMMYLESVLQEEVGLCMMMRSSRTEPPDLTGIMRVTDDIIESLVCPPPPSDPPVISEEMISGLIVPAPGWSKDFRLLEQFIFHFSFNIIPYFLQSFSPIAPLSACNNFSEKRYLGYTTLFDFNFYSYCMHFRTITVT